MGSRVGKSTYPANPCYSTHLKNHVVLRVLRSKQEKPRPKTGLENQGTVKPAAKDLT